MQMRIGDRTVWLNYHHLYYFKVIAGEGSIARAAEKLRLGQPTLSAQLKQFEEVLGVQLFDREHKRLVLNDAGKLVQDYANEIFRIGSELLEVIHDRLPAKRTHVQIGAIDSVSKRLVLELAQAALKVGNCTVSILEGKADELVRELANHRVDLVISNFVPTLVENSGLYSRSLGRAPVLACGSKEFLGLKKGFPRSLGQAPWVVPTVHSKLRHDLEHYMRTAGIPMDIVAETQDTAVQKLMGVAALGLVPLPAPAAQELLRRKELFEIGEIEGVHEELFLVSASRKIVNPVSSALMKSFRLASHN